MTKRIDMTQLTFCIPVRIDSEHRLQNLLTVLTFYSRHIRASYIVLEADKKRQIKELPKIEKLHYEFVMDMNPVFHRTRYINQMLREATTPLAAIWDTDAIAPMPQLYKAYNRLLTGESIMVYPYDGRFWRLDCFYTMLFKRNLQIKLLEHKDTPRIPMAGFYSVGGAFLVNIQSYKHCGWENEHFAGWGPEDVERYHRMEILGECPERVTGSLYHLFHTRGINSGDFDQNLSIRTRQEYVRVCSMMPDELRTYIATWSWIK